jgi:dCMP deaminase
MLINCNVENIYFAENYPDALSEEMLQEAGVNYVFMEGDFS